MEWRVINAADYGMPQRRRRTYILAYKKDSRLAKAVDSFTAEDWVLEKGIFATAFPCIKKTDKYSSFKIEGSLQQVSGGFNKGGKDSPFYGAGLMKGRQVYSTEVVANYSGPFLTLGDLLIDDKDVPESPTRTCRKYQKGAKQLKRINKATGFEYNYSEGGMAFPDSLDKPSRTIITGEGGSSPSRFKHVVKTPSGRYRRLVPVELERLDMFPDNHTAGASDLRRAFLMGNALVTGIVEKVGAVLASY